MNENPKLLHITDSRTATNRRAKNKSEESKIINRRYTSIRIWWKNWKWIWNSIPSVEKWWRNVFVPHGKWISNRTVWERAREREIQDMEAIQHRTLCVNHSIHYFITLNSKDLCENAFFHFDLKLCLIVSRLMSHDHFIDIHFCRFFSLITPTLLLGMAIFIYCHWQSPGHLRHLYLIFSNFSILFFNQNWNRKVLDLDGERWTVNRVFKSWWLNDFAYS